MLISFEGIDGAGKSTQARKLKEYLEERGLDAVLLREPGGTSLGEAVRDLLLREDPLPLTELLLFEAARSELVGRLIRPLLDEGKVVILDRFTDSTLAYQSYGRGLDANLVEELNRTAAQGLVPKLTILIDLEPHIALSRKRDKNRFENADFIRRVREGFLEIARKEMERFYIIDGNRPPSAVFEEVKKAVEEKLWELRKL